MICIKSWQMASLRHRGRS